MKTRVLIADDEAIVANHMRRMLEHSGYDVLGLAVTGEEIVAKALALHPDVILMDIRLSGPTDGITAAERIHGSADIPVVYVTAYTDEETLSRVRMTGTFGFVTKPFEEGSLRAAIEMALYKHLLESRLRVSEERYRLIFTLAPVGIVRYSPEYAVQECNEQFGRLFGLAAESLIGTDLRTLLGKAFAPFLASALTGGTELFEGPCVSPGTRATTWIAVRTGQVHDAGGEFTGAIAVADDISEQRRTEEELIRLVKLESLIADLSGEMIAVTPVSFQQHVNRMLQVIGGFVGAERAFLHLFEDGPAVIRSATEWVIEGNAPRVEEFRGLDCTRFAWLLNRCAEGEPICVLRSAELPGEAASEREFWQSLGIRSLLLVPLARQNSSLGYLGVTTEHEERNWTGENIRLLRLVAQNLVNLMVRHRAEEGWLQSEEKFHLLIESLQEVIFACDKDGFFTYLSQGMEQLTGYSPDELLGEHLTRFIHPHDREFAEGEWDRVLCGITATFQCRVLTKGGNIRQVRVSARSQVLGREVAGITGILLDVTHDPERPPN